MSEEAPARLPGRAAFAVLVATGSGISVPNPRAGMAPDPLLRGNVVWRRLSLSTMVSSLRIGIRRRRASLDRFGRGGDRGSRRRIEH